MILTSMGICNEGAEAVRLNDLKRSYRYDIRQSVKFMLLKSSSPLEIVLFYDTFDNNFGIINDFYKTFEAELLVQFGLTNLH